MRRADFNGHQTCYAYDLARNLETARVEGLAAGGACPASLATYTPAANTAERKILTEWDTRFRLPTKLVEAGRETVTVYDSHGNVTSRIVKDTATGKTRTWSTAYTYHASVPGVLMQKIEDGPRTDVADTTTTDYYPPDAACPGGGLGCRAQVKTVTNALGHVVSHDEYDANGRLTRTTDANGIVTVLTYTPRGWLKTRTVDTETDTFDYDHVGQLVKHTRPDGSYIRYTYDAAHRLTDIVLMDDSRLHYTLDAAGNRTKEEIIDASGGVYATHSRQFDALGRLWKDIGALNQTITYGYDAQGNLKTEDGARTDAVDTTSHDYDALNRLTQTLAADNGITKQAWNARDELAQVTDPVNQSTGFVRDGLGGISPQTSADTGTTTRTYDDAGNLKTETDARGVTVTYTWDELNRLKKKSSSDPNTPVYQYLYDGCANGVGRLCWTRRGNALDLYYDYDTQGRVTTRSQFSAGVTVAYTYAPGGQLATMTYPGGRIVTYSYDSQGRISKVATQASQTAPVTVLARQFSHYPFGPANLFTYGNGQTFWQMLDQDYRPSLWRDGPYGRYLDFDEAGDVSQLSDFSSNAITFTYDPVGRLLGATDTTPGSYGLLGWAYDKNGNRQSETRNASTLPYTYNPTGSNWLFQKGSDTRPRTLNGNLASSPLFGSLSYDGYNRLAATSLEATVYSYNALGQRYKKTNQSGLTSVYLYDDAGRLLYEKRGTDTREYIWLDDRPLARVDNGSSVYTYHVDRLGTPQAMTSQSGATVWKASYEPFGKANVTIATVENNLRFPGQYYDRETGLHYNYFRDYDPTTGRYVEADPIGLDGGINLYAYVENRPTMMVDPLGLKGWYCQRPLGKPPGTQGPPLFNHQYLCVTRADGSVSCGGLTTDGNLLSGEPRLTRPDEDYYDPKSCKEVDDDKNQCFEQCVLRNFSKPNKPRYGIGPLTDCQEYADDLDYGCKMLCNMRKGGW